MNWINVSATEIDQYISTKIAFKTMSNFKSKLENDIYV